MKIAINTLPLLRNKAGAEQYTFNIINELAKIDKKNQYYIIVSSLNKDIYKINQDNFNLIQINTNTKNKIIRILLEQALLPLLLLFKNIDVLFSPCNIMPILSPCFNVTMIFDMHWFIESKKINKGRLFYIKNFIKLSAIRSNKVLTLSESSKKDIVKYTNIDEKKITVTPIGKTPLCALKHSLKKDDWQDVKLKYKLDKKYILFIGQLLYRKNVDIVIKAMAGLTEDDFDFIIIDECHRSS